MTSKLIVSIDERLLRHISVREWGLPGLCVPGKIWRSEQHNTITCMTYRDTGSVNIETLPLRVVEAGSKSNLPDHWRSALWEYVQAWPWSGCCYGPFLAIPEKARCDLIRKLAATLINSDIINCCSIADNIGMLAAFGYDTEIEAPK